MGFVVYFELRSVNSKMLNVKSTTTKEAKKAKFSVIKGYTSKVFIKKV